MKPIPAVLLTALVLSSCARSAVNHADWATDVRLALNEFIAAERRGADKYVVFDFDNTCSIFDISEQLMIYQLETMAFGLDPEGFSQMALSGMDGRPEALLERIRGLITGYADLYGRYGPFSYAGVSPETAERLQADPVWKDFAVSMMGMYDGLQAYMTSAESYTWTLGWFSGMTGEEVYDLSRRSHELYRSVETAVRSWTSADTSFTWIDGIQVTENIRELWKALDDNGFDVWVCSASEIAPVLAAVDVFGLHDACTGVLAMTMARDSSGRYLPEYDYTDGCGWFAAPDGGWVRDSVPTRTRPFGPGKVDAIRNCLVPRYGGKGPLAGFMDSTGDFNFCTEFASMRLCVCFNRATRKVTDGGGLVAEVAMYEKETLRYNYRKARRHGDILYLLQGRDENGLRTLRPSPATLRLGAEEPRLYCNGDNDAQLAYFVENHLSVKEILDRFSLRTAENDPANPLGFRYGFLDAYAGYRSRE